MYTSRPDYIAFSLTMPTPYSHVSHRDVPRPNDVSGRQFEEMCLIIYSHQYTDAMFYSRGHKQHGIDLKMRERPSYGPVRDVLVQCKNTKSLPPCKVEDNIRAALTRWAPKRTEDPDLLLIVATTVDQPDTDALNTCFDDIADKLLVGPLRSKVGLVVHGWADLTRFVRETRPLSEYFLERSAEDGAVESVEVERIGKCMRECLDAGRLKDARAYWDQVQVKFAGVKLPVAFSDGLVELFLRAGDFSALDVCLDGLLATRRYRAGYWVAYLRAKRFNSMVTRPRNFAEMMTARPEPPFDLGDTIRQQTEWLLPAQGSLDDTLTLASWMIAYGGRQAATAGLLRALSLIRQHWDRETELPLPGGDEHWTVRDGRLVPHAQPLLSRRMSHVPTTSQERKAVVLVRSYEYLRMLFSTRFGYDSLLETECEGGKWTTFFDEKLDVLSVEYYFSRSGAYGFEPHAARDFDEAGLTGFYAEAKRLHFDWHETDIVYLQERRPDLPYSAVCTSDVLLADCEHQYSERRRMESLLLSHTLSIERVIAVMRMLQILDDDLCRASVAGAGNVYAKRLGKLRELVRNCWLENRRTGTRDVVVRAVYDDVGGGTVEDDTSGTCGKPGRSRWVSNELRAAIGLSNSSSSPLLTNFSDFDRAKTEGAKRISLPWRVNESATSNGVGWRDVMA